jgi:hypothetical protein
MQHTHRHVPLAKSSGSRLQATDTMWGARLMTTPSRAILSNGLVREKLTMSPCPNRCAGRLLLPGLDWIGLDSIGLDSPIRKWRPLGMNE